MKTYIVIGILAIFLALTQPVNAIDSKYVLINYTFEDGSGNTVTDSSIYGNDGELRWGDSWSSAVKHSGSYSTYYNDSNWVITPPYLDWSNTSGGAVSLWVNASPSTSELRLIFDKNCYDGSWHNSFRMQMNTDDTLTAWLTDGSGWHSISTSAIPEEEWVHIVFGMNVSHMAIWINGTIWAYDSISGSYDASSSVCNVTIGYYDMVNFPNSNVWIGYIDDFQMFNASLSEADIQELYSGIPETEYTPTAEWGAGTTADNSAFNSTNYRRWIYANVTSNTTLSSATLEVLKPSSGTKNYTMTVSGTSAYINATVDRDYTTDDTNTTFRYRVWVFNGSNSNVTDWRTAYFNITYVAYNVSAYANEAPETCFAKNGIAYCARGGATTDQSYNAFYVANGSIHRKYGSTTGSNTAPYVDSQFVYGLEASTCLFSKWWEGNSTAACSIDLGTDTCNPEALEYTSDGKLIYAKEDNGKLFAIWTENCTLAANTTENIGQPGIPVLDEAANRLYIGGSGLIYSYWLNLTQIWNVSVTGNNGYSSPTIIDDAYVGIKTIIFPIADSNMLYAVYENGTIRWSVDAGTYNHQGGAYRNGLFVIGDSMIPWGGYAEPNITAWHVSNGTLAWRFSNTSLDTAMNAPVIIGYNDNYYVLAKIMQCTDIGCGGGSGWSGYRQFLYIIDLNTGQQIDYLEIGNRVTSMKTLVYGGFALTGSQAVSWKWFGTKLGTGGSLTATTCTFGTGAEGRWHHNYFNETAAQGFYFAEISEPLALGITWNTPINNSFTNNVTYILWNATISETPDACILSINGTANYTMSISGNDCHYTASNLTNATTYCGMIYANNSISNSSTTQCATISLTSAAPTPTRLIDNLGLFAPMALFALGAGILIFLLDALLGSGSALLQNPKALIGTMIAALIMAVMILSLL